MPLFGFPFSRKDSRPSIPAESLAFLKIDSTTDLPAFLGWVSARLPYGEGLVAVKDLASKRREFRTRPMDPRAELVARVDPRLLRGSLSSTTRYYRVPLTNLRGIETHTEQGVFSHAYEVLLQPILRGHGHKVPQGAA